MKNESLENRIDVVESPEPEDDKRNFYFFHDIDFTFHHPNGEFAKCCFGKSSKICVAIPYVDICMGQWAEYFRAGFKKAIFKICLLDINFEFAS